jgi:RNA polymerase sigma factor (sigma-70 family)
MDATVPLELGQLLRAPDNEIREAAWEKLIAGHTRLLLAVARSFGGDHDIAMERYSYMLEKLREADFRRLRAFDANAGASFSTWLTVASRRLCLDYHRVRYGRHRSSSRSTDAVSLPGLRRALEDSSGAPIDTDLLPDTAVSAELYAVRREREESLRSELARLTPRERLLVTLRFEDELTAARITGILGLPSPFHVYRQLNAVLVKLRRALESRGIDSTDG